MMLDRGELLKALRQFRRGDFSVRMPLNMTGIDGEIAQAFNDCVEMEEAKAAEIARVAELVGKDGQFNHRMSVPGATGGDTARHDHEVSDAKWVRLRQALRLMTYPNEREMVRRAAEALGRPVAD